MRVVRTACGMQEIVLMGELFKFLRRVLRPVVTNKTIGIPYLEKMDLRTDITLVDVVEDIFETSTKREK